MPGVRRSQRCQYCKERRIKCDQNWPTCGHCKRLKQTCSGPPPLTQFIHQSRYSSLASDKGRGSGIASTGVTSGSQLEPAVLVSHRPVRPVKGGSTSYGVYRLEVPRTRLTTSADRVSSRLVGLLERGYEAGVRLQMSYLPFLPQRLIQSPCLRDCTALFCYAWNEYRRRQPISQLLLTSLYGKAIRGLQNAIKGGQTYEVETLAAMVLLERAGSLFGRCQIQSTIAQRRAIRHVLEEKGRPVVGDELDMTLSYENQWLRALPVMTDVPENMLPLEPGWLEVIDKFQSEPPHTEEFSCFSGEYHFIKNATAKMLAWIVDVGQIMGSPTTMKDVKDTLVQDLSYHTQILEGATLRILTKGSIHGSIVELPDSTFFAGRRYDFASLSLAHYFAGLLAVRRGILRIAYDLVALYGPPDENLLAKFRDLSIQQWMVFPYLSQVGSVSEYFLTPCLKPSLEGTDRFEMGYLINVLSSINSYQQRSENKDGS